MMGKNIYGWELDKTKANLKNMKVVWNSCKRELWGTKSVNAMKAITIKGHLKTSKGNSLLEKFICKIFRK